MTKTKKALLLTGIGIDIAVTIFFFVISIIMIIKSVTMDPVEIKEATGFIGYLQNHTTVYFWGFVFPLFILLALNIFGLVFYLKKAPKKEKVQVNDLTDEQKEALKRELLGELSNKDKE